MQVSIELTDDQVDEILVEGLKDGFWVNLNFKDEPNYYEINQAFMTLLAYYMGDKAYDKFIKHYVKGSKSKKLVEAYGGL